MKTFTHLLCVLILSIVLFACNNAHFLKEESYRNQVAQDFEQKKQALPHGDLFAIFADSILSVYEREALMFLYAYMPIGDVTDYPGDYYLENVRLSKQTRDEMPWGKEIPDEVFRHFVLPIRVNNENLDDSRRVFYDELKDRVKGLPMKDAILEVNHWCHEKVVYRHQLTIGICQNCVWTLWRRVYIYGGCAPGSRYSGTASVYAPLGAYG